MFSLYSCVNEIIFVRNSQLVHSYSQTPHDKLHIAQVKKYILSYNFDLLTKYHIYCSRGCDSIKENYSKNKILNELELLYTNSNTNHLKLLCFYSFLRTNAQLFGIKTEKPFYNNYKIYIDKHDHQLKEALYTNLINGYKTYVTNKMIKLLKDNIEILYCKLRNSINKLD